VDDLQPIGRLLVVAGLIVAVVGALLILSPKLPWLGNLPGDIRVENENVKVFIPLGTMLLISVVLTVLFNLLNRR
jgi:hypothetical protein